MATIKQTAQEYEPKETKNIADLKKMSVEANIQTRTYNEGTADEFKVNVIEYEGEDYRIPTSVIKQLKALLEEKPEMEYFKVKKTGTGMQTSYMVMEA